MEKEMFRNMGSKIDVFSEYGEWENEHKMSNGVLWCMEWCMLLSKRRGFVHEDGERDV